MEQKLVKEAFGEALKDSEQEKKEKIKKIILGTLKKKTELEEKVKELQKEIKILSKDLEDFKQGRLDLIEERQRVDEDAQKVSVVLVKEVEIVERPYYPRPWYEPFKITYTSTWDNMSKTTFSDSSSSYNSTFQSTGSDFHNFFSGSYDVGSKIINL